jgi:predicted glutamine amidotransferase
MGGLTFENTHPFCLGNYSFCHNGTVLEYPRLLGPNVRTPHGDTDSEHLFNLLMCEYDPADPVDALRRTALRAVDSGPFSGLNFLFSDGERLYAYRLGIFDLHWLARPGQLLVASEKVTDERWHTVQQDVLLVVDSERLDEPHAERLIGDDAVARADIRKFDEGVGLRGAERGEFAAARAASAAASANDR